MSVESVIIENSKEPLKALAPRAEKAAETPDHGIKVVTKGAYFVIRDCATVAKRYLPLLLYGSYKDPIKALKGKLTEMDFMNFLKKEDVESVQLSKLMVLDAMKVVEFQTSSTISTMTSDDVYGEYGSEPTGNEPTDFDINNKSHVLKILTKAFGKD